MKLQPVYAEDGSLVTYSACISPLISKICVNVELDPFGDFFTVSTAKQNEYNSLSFDKNM